MRAIRTQTTNFTLIGKDDNVADLPVTRIEFSDGTVGVESCWQLSDKDLEEIIKNRKIYYCCLAPTHAPASINVVSVLDSRFSEFDFAEEQNQEEV